MTTSRSVALPPTLKALFLFFTIIDDIVANLKPTVGLGLFGTVVDSTPGCPETAQAPCRPAPHGSALYCLKILLRGFPPSSASPSPKLACPEQHLRHVCDLKSLSFTLSFRMKVRVSQPDFNPCSSECEVWPARLPSCQEGASVHECCFPCPWPPLPTSAFADPISLSSASFSLHYQRRTLAAPRNMGPGI